MPMRHNPGSRSSISGATAASLDASNYRMVSLRVLSAVIVLGASTAIAQTSPKQIVQTVVQNELKADSSDHSRWMYQDHKKTPERSTLKLIVETPKGDLSKTLKLNGRDLTPEERAADDQRIQKMVSDPAEQQKQAQERKQDGQKARDMMKMLPDAFVWTETGRERGEIHLAFRPNPNFDPPTRESRVFAAMAGTMDVNEAQMRLQSLKGRLTQDVDFGWGLLGRLDQGGTFNIERKEVAPQEWQIVETHVHINGHALIFKSISQNEDEITFDYKPVPQNLSLTEARQILEKGEAPEVNASAAKPSSEAAAEEHGKSGKNESSALAGRSAHSHH